MISTFPPAAAATPGRHDEAQGAHRAPIDGGGDTAVQLVCQLRDGEFVGTTVSGRPFAVTRPVAPKQPFAPPTAARCGWSAAWSRPAAGAHPFYSGSNVITPRTRSFSASATACRRSTDTPLY